MTVQHIYLFLLPVIVFLWISLSDWLIDKTMCVYNICLIGRETVLSSNPFCTLFPLDPLSYNIPHPPFHHSRHIVTLPDVVHRHPQIQSGIIEGPKKVTLWFSPFELVSFGCLPFMPLFTRVSFMLYLNFIVVVIMELVMSGLGVILSVCFMGLEEKITAVF